MRGKRAIKLGGTRGSVFRDAAKLRLEDGRALLDARRYGGAIYLVGYAIECLLKWAVTYRRELLYLPSELEIHDWEILLFSAGLASALQKEAVLRNIFGDLSERWGPELRYQTRAISRTHSHELYEQMARLYNWIAEHTI